MKYSCPSIVTTQSGLYVIVAVEYGTYFTWLSHITACFSHNQAACFWGCR